MKVLIIFFADSESLLKEINKAIEKNIDIFSKLNEKFPNVESFSEALELNNQAKKVLRRLSEIFKADKMK